MFFLRFLGKFLGKILSLALTIFVIYAFFKWGLPAII